MDHLVPLQTDCLESGVATQVTFPHTRGLIHSIFDPHFFGLWCELVNLTEYVYNNSFCLQVHQPENLESECAPTRQRNWFQLSNIFT